MHLSFLSVYVRMLLCCHDNSSLNDKEHVAALANPLPSLAFLCKDKSLSKYAVSLASLVTVPQLHLEQ